MKPIVSVVIPCFNLGAYLDEAVQSVLDQTFQDFEIVIVDDGSEDPATRHMLASYRRPKTRIVRTENRGLARARNTGLQESGGRYVSFLDADDALEPGFLDRGVRKLESDDSIAFVSSWLKAFGEGEFDWTPERCDFPHLLAEDTVCTAALTRRDLIVDIGGFDPDMPVSGYEDWELAISLVERGHPGTIVPEFLFRYRIRLGSMTETCTEPGNHARLMAYIVDKHSETYRQHYQGVVEVIEGRIADLEQLSPTVPLRPAVALDGWRDRILVLENHRRALQDSVVTAEPDQAEHLVEWGSFRRLSPISRTWGLDRTAGRPFLHRAVPAAPGSRYQRTCLGGQGRCLRAHIRNGGHRRRRGGHRSREPGCNPGRDLARPGSLPEERFDCFVLTQTVHVIYEVEEVARNAHKTLRPGGVLLATLPCLSRIDYESGVDGDYWRFTPASARRLFGAVFGLENVEVESWGSVLTCTAFLQGLAAEDLEEVELAHRDPYFPLLVTIRARKRAGPTHTYRQEGTTPAQIRVVEVGPSRGFRPSRVVISTPPSQARCFPIPASTSQAGLSRTGRWKRSRWCTMRLSSVV